MTSRFIRCLSTAALTVVGVSASATVAHAQTTYTSFASWLAVVGSASWTVDFSSFDADQQFQTATVDAGPFSLAQVGSTEFRNLIDVSPFNFGDGGGTTGASMFTDFGATTVNLVPDAPLSAWGAEFFNALTSERLQLRLFGTGDVLLNTFSLPRMVSSASRWTKGKRSPVSASRASTRSSGPRAKGFSWTTSWV